MAEEAFKKESIVPDVVPVAPKATAEVKYPSGASAALGNELTPTLVKDSPTVTWDAEKGAYYTVVMTDPDAPSRADPKWREWHHWIVANCPGGDLARGEVLSAYIGSGPPQGTGLHRYVFLVYRQPGGEPLKFTEPRLPSNSARDRPGFKVHEFASKYGLGAPVAGNFFQAQWDDYVVELYKGLSSD